ncbi:hypothetical protein PY365_13885 [Roseiarcaceae bacterium H3SJ34-1]|uniref:hypothetical protein n=1 Tax=Terripilifer ovatus TaxID=3032367 RepID=UPI003AB9770E|nr:hypothetical protein [Roseiarcaceae bacterium H3SJ34-1]
MPTTSDTSWFITASEFLLDGKKLYIDIGETNPPASIWLYVPAVAFARLIGMKPEIAVVSWIFMIMAGSFACAAAILARSGLSRRFDMVMMGATGLALFAILPGDTFSQREHIAALLILPFLAATLARVHNLQIGFPLMIAAGLCGGVVAVIKPHFVLALELPVLVAFAARPGWRTIFSAENVTAGLVTVAYVASTLIFHPLFWHEVMRVNAVVYLPLADRGQGLWIALALAVALAPACGIYSGRKFLRRPGALCYAAFLGFSVAFVLQGKLWVYHFYPAITIGILGVALAVLYRPAELQDESTAFGKAAFASRQWLTGIFIPYLAALFVLLTFSVFFFRQRDYEPLAAAITRIKAAPSIAIFSGEIAVGHPVTRMVRGRWSMTQPALWVQTNGLDLRARSDFDASTLPVVEAIENADMAVFLSDLRRNRPDILLAKEGDETLRARLQAYPGMAQELDRYRLVDTVVVERDSLVVDIYARQDRLSPR